jgi:hypothetical protein
MSNLSIVKPKCEECGSEEFKSRLCDTCELNSIKDKAQLQHALEAEQAAYIDLEQEAVSYRDENDKLKSRIKELEEKLSEFQNGLPIEKAKEGGDYYCLDLGYCVATYFENGQWYYSDDGPNRNPCEVSNRLYPLPSTDTKEDN